MRWLSANERDEAVGLAQDATLRQMGQSENDEEEGAHSADELEDEDGDERMERSSSFEEDSTTRRCAAGRDAEQRAVEGSSGGAVAASDDRFRFLAYLRVSFPVSLSDSATYTIRSNALSLERARRVST